MGDAAIGPLVNDLSRRLTSVAVKELALLWGFGDNISILKDDFDRIEAVLHDAEGTRIKEKAEELWLIKRLRSIFLMVENLLDDISTEALLRGLHKERGIKYRVRAFFSSKHNQLMFRVRMAHKVKAIRRKLDDLSVKRSDLKLTPSDSSNVDKEFVRHMPDRETSSFIHDSSVIFGRNEEVEMVIKMICNKNIEEYYFGEIMVYGIWGMGGVGKTTLAQLVYNDERVNKYFDFKCWVYVSTNFQVNNIIKKIIESIDKGACVLSQLELLQESLQSKLREKKILIVLDDVWIEDGEKNKWGKLSETLSCGAEGSIIVMTTRSQATSQMMAKVPDLQHKLGCLSKDDSWLLFKKFAFAKGREGGDISELEPIGREIVEKCEGLPLAVKTLGSLMWSKNSISEWERVKRSTIWEMPLENNIESALKLSYDNLLPYLRYCGLFPKGYEMEKDDMIQLWVVNGFIPQREEIELYELGEEILNCLVWRSFFQVVKHNIFKMHDLMHDLARHVIGDDCLIIESGYKKDVRIPNEALHLSSSRPSFLFLPQDLGKLTSLRSILMFEKEYECSISQNFSHVYLRVLYLRGILLRTLPQTICKLKHLKYLNLSKSGIAVLPESIIYLQNLQVFVLSSCVNLYELPESICQLKLLTYLNISESSIVVLPESITNLQNLRTLILRF